MLKIKGVFILIFFFDFVCGTSFETLKLISYNIHGFKGKKTQERISEIIENIKEFDIILFQENWSYKNIFLEKLNDFNFVFSDEETKKIYPSGLTLGIRNNILITEYEFNDYSGCSGYVFNGSDCFASKGFSFYRINYYGNIVDIYNTHLDAGRTQKDRNIRKLQIQELKDYVLNKNSNYPIIICGDFNIDYFSDERNIIEKFISDLKLNIIDWNMNEHFNNKIDYIFYNKINVADEGNIKDILYYLSDHPPMHISFNFIKE